MNDERDWHEVDRRLQAATRPDPASVQRTVAAALCADPAPRTSRRPTMAALGLLAGALLAGAVWRWQAKPAARPTVSIRSEGSVIVAEAADGRRWIVGSNTAELEERNYMIVVAVGKRR